MTPAPRRPTTRRAWLLAAAAGACVPVAWAAAPTAVDGAASSAGAPAAPVPAVPASTAPLAGTVESLTLASRHTGVDYPIRLYRPSGDPGPGGPRAEPLPLVYLLDAEWRLATLARIAEAAGRRIRIAGIANEATRNHDDVPPNACIPGGGGHAAFRGFVVDELLPFVEARVPVEPAKRCLMGHSFGGAFVLYVLFGEAPDRHRFDAYLAADPGIRCLGDSAYAWEAACAVSTDRLPVRLHLSYANPVTAPFAERIRSRGYRDLRFASTAYAGGHDGMIPAAFADALDFALG